MKLTASISRLVALGLLTVVVLLTGCRTSTNLGVNVGIHNGSVQVRPTAGIDFIGDPIRR